MEMSKVPGFHTATTRTSRGCRAEYHGEILLGATLCGEQFQG